MKKFSIFLFFFVISRTAAAEVNDIYSLNLSDLGNVKVTSVSKSEESSLRAAAAVFVISNEDLKRSGATTIPEALRMVPGISVARSSSNKWAVSSRGFNDTLSNKLLVLIDGRSVYTPQFSGVFWDSQDYLFEDIDRIEVIRGPGASLWGANAVNGVINIITKKASDTVGNYVAIGAGNQEKSFLEARRGIKVNENTSFRTYYKGFNKNNESSLIGNNDVNNKWEFSRAGFRSDINRNNNASITFQGDVYNGKENITLNIPTFESPYSTILPGDGDISGGNLLFKIVDNSSEAKNTLTSYFDSSLRHFENIEIDIKQYDLDFQQDREINDRSILIWGAGFRYVWDDFNGTRYFKYNPNNSNESLYSSFLMHKYSLLPNKLTLTTGTKIEHNDYTGFEIQPNIRLALYPDSTSTVWGSVSRAVRTPSRSEDSIDLVVGSIKDKGYIKWLGNSSMVSEELIAYEIGYKNQINSNLYIDLSVFLNDYQNLRTTEIGKPRPETAIPLYFFNKADGKSHGLEAAIDFKATDSWALKGSYSLINIDINVHRDSTDNQLIRDEGKTPDQVFSVRSQFDITNNLQLDNSIYFVDSLPSIRIPSYTRFDSRLAWQISDGIELSAVAINLFDDKTQEFARPLNELDSQIRRSIFGKIVCKF